MGKAYVREGFIGKLSKVRTPSLKVFATSLRDNFVNSASTFHCGTDAIWLETSSLVSLGVSLRVHKNGCSQYSEAVEDISSESSTQKTSMIHNEICASGQCCALNMYRPIRRFHSWRARHHSTCHKLLRTIDGGDHPLQDFSRDRGSTWRLTQAGEG